MPRPQPPSPSPRIHWASLLWAAARSGLLVPWAAASMRKGASWLLDKAAGPLAIGSVALLLWLAWAIFAYAAPWLGAAAARGACLAAECSGPSIALVRGPDAKSWAAALPELGASSDFQQKVAKRWADAMEAHRAELTLDASEAAALSEGLSKWRESLAAKDAAAAASYDPGLLAGAKWAQLASAGMPYAQAQAALRAWAPPPPPAPRRSESERAALAVEKALSASEKFQATGSAAMAALTPLRIAFGENSADARSFAIEETLRWPAAFAGAMALLLGALLLLLTAKLSMACRCALLRLRSIADDPSPELLAAWERRQISRSAKPSDAKRPPQKRI